jgi:hypothetical protein
MSKVRKVEGVVWKTKRKYGKYSAAVHNWRMATDIGVYRCKGGTHSVRGGGVEACLSICKSTVTPPWGGGGGV